jgi:hypothetical protein
MSVVAQACDPSIQETGTGGFQVQVQSELHSEMLSQNNQTESKQNKTQSGGRTAATWIHEDRLPEAALQVGLYFASVCLCTYSVNAGEPSILLMTSQVTQNEDLFLAMTHVC